MRLAYDCHESWLYVVAWDYNPMTAESHSWDFLSHVADLSAMGFFNPISRVNNVVGLTIP